MIHVYAIYSYNIQIEMVVKESRYRTSTKRKLDIFQFKEILIQHNFHNTEIFQT